MPKESMKTRLKNFAADNMAEIIYATCLTVNVVVDIYIIRQKISLDAQLKKANKDYDWSEKMRNALIDAVRDGHEFKWDEEAQTLWDLTVAPDKK